MLRCGDFSQFRGRYSPLLAARTEYSPHVWCSNTIRARMFRRALGRLGRHFITDRSVGTTPAHISKGESTEFGRGADTVCPYSSPWEHPPLPCREVNGGVLATVKCKLKVKVTHCMLCSGIYSLTKSPMANAKLILQDTCRQSFSILG